MPNLTSSDVRFHTLRRRFALLLLALILAASVLFASADPAHSGVAFLPVEPVTAIEGETLRSGETRAFEVAAPEDALEVVLQVAARPQGRLGEAHFCGGGVECDEPARMFLGGETQNNGVVRVVLDGPTISVVSYVQAEIWVDIVGFSVPEGTPGAGGFRYAVPPRELPEREILASRSGDFRANPSDSLPQAASSENSSMNASPPDSPSAGPLPSHVSVDENGVGVPGTGSVGSSQSTGTPEPAPESTPEPAPESTPEPAPESTPEPAPESTPEPTPEPAPEPTPEPVDDGSDAGAPGRSELKIVEGDLYIQDAGTVIEGVDLRGRLIVEAPNVVVKNSVIRGDSDTSTSLPLVSSRSTGLTIQDTEIAAQFPSPNVNGVMGSNFTLIRVNIHSVIDQVHIHGDGNVTIQDSRLHSNLHYASDPNWGGGPSHDDNVQIQSGSNITITGTELAGSKSAAVMITQDAGAVSNVRIDNNTIGGGACAINITEKAKGPLSGIQVNDNVFRPDQTFSGCAIKRPTTSAITILGNTWVDGEVVVPTDR